ncbi:MAG TPA: flagellar basal body-associated FliL family protein [Clostridiales bacterium]|nr:flagellar basal body-associated FliL family protein [Clostridiales bacterium]
MNNRWMIFVTILLVIFITISIFLVVNIYKTPKVENEKNNKENGTSIVFNTGDSFITNIKDDKSILKCDIYIEVDNKETAEQLKEDIPKIRDRIILILRELTIDDVERQDIQTELKKRIQSELQENLDVQNITNIYFNEFVVQH